MKKVYKINNTYFNIADIKTIEEPIEESMITFSYEKYINGTRPQDCKTTRIVINDKTYCCQNYIYKNNNPMQSKFCLNHEDVMKWFEQERLHPSTIEITKESLEDYEKQRQEYFDLVKAFKEL